MTTSEQKRIAKKALQTSICVAYYRVIDSNRYSQQNEKEICDIVQKYAKKLCENFGVDFKEM